MSKTINYEGILSYVDKDGVVHQLFSRVRTDKALAESGIPADAAAVGAELKKCFQSVSDGKALVASAITDKRVPTDATATFAQMAENIMKIVLGSGNATAGDVLAGKTFTNDDGVEYEGTMPNIEDVDTAIASNYVEGGSSGTGIYAHMNAGAHVTNASSGYPEIFIPQTQIANMFSANSVSSVITQGYTAWVNGVKITGTRPAIVSKQSGSFDLWIALTNEVVSKIVTFSTPFDKVPTISVAITKTENNTDRDDWQIVEVSKTYFKFSTRGHNWKYCTIGVEWVAEA